MASNKDSEEQTLHLSCESLANSLGRVLEELAKVKNVDTKKTKVGLQDSRTGQTHVMTLETLINMSKPENWPTWH